MLKKCIIKGVYESVNKNGSVSYRVQICGDDPKNPNKRKVYCKTFPGLPEGASKKEIEAYVEKLKVKWRLEVRQLVSDGKKNITPIEQGITFSAYANRWLAEVGDAHSNSYYERGREAIEKFNKYFGKMKIEDITRADIQKAIDDICKTEICKPYATIKNPSVKVIENGYKNLNAFCKLVGLTRVTVLMVRQGKRVEIITAERICNALGIPLRRHFNVFEKPKRYKKYTVHGFFRIVRTVLGHAVQRGILQFNPAYGNGVIKITARETYNDVVSEDKVFNYEEYKQFEIVLQKNIKKIMEQYEIKSPQKDYYNIRKSILLLIGIHTGLRNGELCGLMWDDIDLDKRKLRVVRNAVYTYNHGICIGKPKSRSSLRTLSISPLLTKQLEQYKKWWDRENLKLDVSDKFLFLRQNGKLIHPSTPLGWLTKLLKENNMKHIGMHGLRHTHATISIVHFKADIKTVSVRLGHSKVGLTLDVYTHFIPKGDEELADMWDN